MNRSKVLTALVACFVTTQALAKVASVSLENLVKQSDIIVVAKVESVNRPIIGKRYAKAKVLEVWKGPAVESVEFLASRTWTCDISDAKKGETALLFLKKGGKSRSYAIAHSGRGRLPLRPVDGKQYATFWPDIRLPENAPTIDGPDPQWDFIRSVELEWLRDFVQKALKNKQAGK